MTTRIELPTIAHAKVSNKSVNLLLTFAVIGLVLGIYHETVWSIVAIWIRSDTYAHGFLIVPFSLYMVWDRRETLKTIAHQPDYLPLLLLAGLGFIWLLATLASVMIVQQYVLVAMLPVIVWAMLGNKIFIATIFPLIYLFFAVPFGDSLIPPLINFTADFTVGALQLTGIPVYREGSFFSVPSGNWSVVEACSGVRYLIASVTLGTLYAYLTYQSLSRRIIFIGLSIIVPIIANGLRAYLIVMTGHLSNMTLAVGVDHLIYGWLFFGIVMLLLFWAGSFWREDQQPIRSIIQIGQTDKDDSQSGATSKATWGVAGLIMIITAIWPLYAQHLSTSLHQQSIPALTMANHSDKWQPETAPLSDWVPVYVGSPVQYIGHFSNNDRRVSVYVTYYRNQKQGNELINYGNTLVASNSGWIDVLSSRQDISVDNAELTVTQNQLRASTDKLLTWRWWWLGDYETSNPYMVKFLMAVKQLFGQGDDGAEIIIAAHYETDPQEAILLMRQFVADMMPAIREDLDSTKNQK
ncbi:MAG: exosortase A [Nitrosomonas sp.]|nr:exosortase A [Nitrosomonas sp.]